MRTTAHQYDGENIDKKHGFWHIDHHDSQRVADNAQADVTEWVFRLDDGDPFTH